MKKLLVVLMTIALISFGGNAFAGGWGIPIGNLDVEASASNTDHSKAFDFSFSPLGVAAGGGHISGGAGAEANGFIINGTVTGAVTADGGGNSQSGTTANLGTWTQNLAVTGATVDLSASGFFGIGAADGSAGGGAEQSSHNGGGGILFNGWTPVGVTLGTASQESSGGFGGDAKVIVPLIGSPEAGFDASITMNGYSHTDSQTLSGPGYLGLQTDVMATTDVISTGGSYQNGFIACADVDGGFSASGQVHTGSAMNMNGGNASAEANGSYSGSASLGYTYNGEAVGYSGAIANDNGVMSAAASMSVTSKITHTPAP